MNHSRVEKLREKLDNLSISDYHGLSSPGLTCYLNSVLQVLFMTEDFREAVKRSCSKDSTTIDTHLAELFTNLERRMAKTCNIAEMLGITDVYEQRDAAEYFERILCLTSLEASKIFKGELNHKTTCLKCNKTNDSRSFFWILPLAMEDSFSETYDVEQGLKDFFNVQRVCKDNQVQCNRCDKKRDADIEWEITQTPDVLTLLLKRFSFDDKRKCYVKLRCKASVPQTLHMERCAYNLYAVVNHSGNLTGGHYTAEIKSFETGHWYRFNDGTVRSVKQLFRARDNSLGSQSAYLLMYRKVSRPPEKIDGSDQEAHCAGEALVPHQLKDESWRGRENLKHYKGDTLKKSHVDAAWRNGTNSSEKLDKLPNQRAARVRQQPNKFPQTDNEADEDRYTPNLQAERFHFAKTQDDGDHREPHRQQLDANRKERKCHLNIIKGAPVAHHVDGIFEHNYNSQKERLEVNTCEIQDSIVTTETSLSHHSPTRKTKGVKSKREEATEVERKSIKQRRAAHVSDIGNSNANSYDVHSHDYSSSSVPYPTRRSHSQCRTNEPTECNNSPDLCNLNINKAKTQHVVTADSDYKQAATRTVTKRKTRASLRDDKEVRRPWR